MIIQMLSTKGWLERNTLFVFLLSVIFPPKGRYMMQLKTRPLRVPQKAWPRLNSNHQKARQTKTNQNRHNMQELSWSERIGHVLSLPGRIDKTNIKIN